MDASTLGAAISLIKKSSRNVSALQESVESIERIVYSNVVSYYTNIADRTTTINGYMMYFDNPALVQSFIPTFDGDTGTFTWRLVTATENFADGLDVTVGEWHTQDVGSAIVLNGVEISQKCGVEIVGNSNAALMYTHWQSLSSAEYRTARMCVNQNNKITQRSSLHSYFFAFDSLVIINGTATIPSFYKKEESNYLYGKRIMACGDSMVEGHTLGANKSWFAKIANRNNMDADNKGTNGAYMTNRQYSSKDNSVYQKLCVSSSEFYISNLGSYDYILIFAGTNDASNNTVTIGSENSVDPTEFYGALNLICDEIQTRAPKAKVGFITPYKRQSGYADYIAAIKTACGKRGIPVFDNSTDGGINWSNSSQESALTLGDTFHLNNTGMEFASYKYEAFLRSL